MTIQRGSGADEAIGRVVVVEDDEGLNHLAQKALRKAGFDPQGVLTGAKAIEVVLADSDDPVLLLDQKLPDMTGTEVIQALAERGRSVPFVAMTAHGDEQTAVEMMKLGARDYLIKGLELTDLLPEVFHRVFRDLNTAKRLAAAEAELRRREERYTLLFNSGNDAVFVHLFPEGRLGRFTEVNDVACARLGYTREELLTMTPDDIDTEGIKDKKRRALERLIQTGRCVFEAEHMAKDGRRLSVEISSRRFESDGATYVMSTARDITQRKENERALAAAHEQYRAIVENAPHGIQITDLEGRIVFSNPAHHRIHGFTDDETLVGRYIWDLMADQAQRDAAQAYYRKIVEERPERGVHYNRDRTRNGHIIDVRVDWDYLYDFHGQLQGICSIITDITDLKIAEEALRESEEKYRLLVDHAEEAIFVAQDGRLGFANPKSAEIVGYPLDQLTAMPFIDFIHPDDRDMVARRHARRLEGGDAPPAYEFRVVTKNDETRWVELKSVRIEWQGRPATLNFLSDITRRKQNEEERARLQDQLIQAQKMEAVGTLAGGISHDFNNLIQAVHGYTQILLLDKTAEDPDFSSLKAIENASHRAADLVRQLMLFSRKAETKRRPVALNQEVEQAQRMLGRTIPKMIDIQLRLGSRLWPIQADPVQMEQILLNLGANAADAMPDGGRLVIETQNITLDEDYPDTHLGARPGRYVLLAISDTGHGMDKETVERIFEPFFTTKDLQQGTGLGLATVYGIVQSHGGHINCYSEIGRGTTFKIYLPAAEPPESEQAEPPAPPPPQGGTETILLVDDEEPIRSFASQALERFGYTVRTASAGEEALEIYTQNPDQIDLVVLDIGMPGMGGHKCLQEILRVDPQAKVLVASGYSINGQMRKTLQSGAQGYVAKPYRLADLLSQVRDTLDGVR